MAKIRLFSRDSNPATDRPFLHKSKFYIDSLLLTGEAVMLQSGDAQLTGWLNRRDDLESSLQRIAGSGFSSAWSIAQSGPTGPLVWQMNT